MKMQGKDSELADATSPWILRHCYSLFSPQLLFLSIKRCEIFLQPRALELLLALEFVLLPFRQGRILNRIFMLFRSSFSFRTDFPLQSSDFILIRSYRFESFEKSRSLSTATLHPMTKLCTDWDER